MPFALSIDAVVEKCVAFRSEEKWEESYALSSEGIASVDFAKAAARTQWRLLEEHALASLWLGKKDEARIHFDRVLEYDLADEDIERTLSNLGYCPEPEKPFRIDWKKYWIGLLFAILTAFILIGPGLLKGCK